MLIEVVETPIAYGHIGKKHLPTAGTTLGSSSLGTALMQPVTAPLHREHPLNCTPTYVHDLIYRGPGTLRHRPLERHPRPSRIQHTAGGQAPHRRHDHAILVEKCRIDGISHSKRVNRTAPHQSHRRSRDRTSQKAPRSSQKSPQHEKTVGAPIPRDHRPLFLNHLDHHPRPEPVDYKRPLVVKRQRHPTLNTTDYE